MSYPSEKVAGAEWGCVIDCSHKWKKAESVWANSRLYMRVLCTTKYCSVLPSITPFDSPTHETPSTMREATSMSQPRTSPNIAPATRNDSHHRSPTYEMSFTMRGETGTTLQPHQILHLPRKIALQNLREICRKKLKRHLQCAADSSMNDPNMIRTQTRHLAPARSPSLRFALRRRIVY